MEMVVFFSSHSVRKHANSNAFKWEAHFYHLNVDIETF